LKLHHHIAAVDSWHTRLLRSKILKPWTFSTPSRDPTRFLQERNTMLLSFWTLLALFGLTLASPVPAPAPIANPAPAPIANPNPSDLIARETDLNAFLSLLLDHLPAMDGTLTAISGILTTFQGFLALVSGKKTTYNQLTSACKPYTVVFARGTVEPGNVGILVGPPFFDALKARVGSAALAVQGVNEYKASIAGYLAGGDV
jgi:hypothetical protein